jgi:hypothetical protein
MHDVLLIGCDFVPNEVGVFVCARCTFECSPRCRQAPWRICDRQPNLKLATTKLGLSEEMPATMTRLLVLWVVGGCIERPEVEQVRLKAICHDCWNHENCFPDATTEAAKLRMATVFCPIHSWEHGGHGCGDELHRLIVRLTRQEITHDCGCGEWITMMNGWTAAENREHIEETITKMRQEADNRGWLLKIAAHFPLATTKWMTEWAIRRAERWEKATVAQCNGS